MNPLNQLPIDVDMVRRVDELAVQCAKETGHFVLVVVMKENGKCHITTEGEPETGWLAELAKDPPALLASVAAICRMNDEIEAKAKRS